MMKKFAISVSMEKNKTDFMYDNELYYVNHSNMRVFKSSDNICVGIAQRILDEFVIFI